MRDLEAEVARGVVEKSVRMSALATLPLLASLLLPTSPSPRFSVAFAPRACIALCDADAPQVMVGGSPIEEGDGILCRDDESDAWWRSTIREIKGSKVLVHFTGCDDAWDTVSARGRTAH